MRRTFPSEAQRVARQHSTASPSQGCRTRGTVRSDDPDSLSIAPEQYSQFYRVGQVTAPGPVAVGNASRGGNSSVQLARAAPIMPGRNSRLQVQQGRVVVAHRSFLRPQPNAPQEALKPCARQERHLLHKWVPTDRSTRRNSGSRRRQQSVAQSHWYLTITASTSLAIYRSLLRAVPRMPTTWRTASSRAS